MPSPRKSKPRAKAAEQTKLKPEWLKTGVPGFDELLEKGIPRGTNILLAGGPGSGKTIFCLQALYNAALNGDTCVYLSFEEPRARLESHIREFGWDLDKLPKGSFTILEMDALKIARTVEALLEYAAGRIRMKLDLLELTELSELRSLGRKNPIIALDSVSALAAAFTGKPENYRVYIWQLFKLFEDMGATTMLITEIEESATKFSRAGVEEFLADGVIVLYNFKMMDERIRAIEILKLRGAKHERKIVPFQITSQGLVLYPQERIMIKD